MSGFDDRKLVRKSYGGGEAGPIVASAHTPVESKFEAFRDWARRPSTIIAIGFIAGFIARGPAEDAFNDFKASYAEVPETRQQMLDYGRCALETGLLDQEACYSGLDSQQQGIFSELDDSWESADTLRQEIDALANTQAVLPADSNE